MTEVLLDLLINAGACALGFVWAKAYYTSLYKKHLNKQLPELKPGMVTHYRERDMIVQRIDYDGYTGATTVDLVDQATWERNNRA